MREVAARLKVSCATVYALCASGDLPHFKVSSNAIRIRSSELDRRIDGQFGTHRDPETRIGQRGRCGG